MTTLLPPRSTAVQIPAFEDTDARLRLLMPHAPRVYAVARIDDEPRRRWWRLADADRDRRIALLYARALEDVADPRIAVDQVAAALVHVVAGRVLAPLSARGALLGSRAREPVDPPGQRRRHRLGRGRGRHPACTTRRSRRRRRRGRRAAVRGGARPVDRPPCHHGAACRPRVAGAVRPPPSNCACGPCSAAPSWRARRSSPPWPAPPAPSRRAAARFCWMRS